MATFIKFHKFLKNQMNGGNGVPELVVDFDSDDIKVSLHTFTYVPNAVGHTTFSDVTNEVTGTGYTAGGETIASPLISEAASIVTFDGADVSWTQDPGGFSDARYAVVRKDSGTNSTSPLIGYYDLGANKGNVNGDYTLVWNASGILNWQ